MDVHVDSAGNIRLVVDHKHDKYDHARTTTFVVSDKVMCIASSVWQAMFDPQGSWAKQSLNQEYHLVDDDPDALLIVLRIAHLDFEKVPTRILDYDLLVQLAVVCDKYDLVRLVRPWRSTWQASVMSIGHNSNYMNYEGCLFIAWAFGDIETFQSITRVMVLTTTVDGSGQLLKRDGRTINVVMHPGSLGEKTLAKFTRFILIYTKKVSLRLDARGSELC